QRFSSVATNCGAFAMDPTQHDESDARAGDLLVGAGAILAFLVHLGWPEDTDPYYLKRSGWPIGNTAPGGGKLIASKRRLTPHAAQIARGPSAAWWRRWGGWWGASLTQLPAS